MEFLSANWLWILFVAAMLWMHLRHGGMHCGGHGGHSGHSTHSHGSEVTPRGPLERDARDSEPRSTNQGDRRRT